MDVIAGIEAFAPPPGGSVVTIGNFDGFHRGHRQMLAAARQAAAPLDVPLVAITFDPHPIAVLHPERAPARLTTHAEKLALLAAAGADVAIVIAATPEFLALSADAFLDRLMRACHPRVIVEGPTFSFGHDRAGTVDTLRAAGERLGFEVQIVPRVRAPELPGNPEINSSAIRAAIGAGRVADARTMLGRPHRLTGLVGSGHGRGGRFGFPTANLDGVPQLVPEHGVYAALAQLDDGTQWPAGVNIGPQPTFGQDTSRVEAHLLGFDGDLRGRRVGLHLLSWLRSQQRFDTADDLTAQLRRDLAGVAAVVRATPLPDSILRLPL